MGTGQSKSSPDVQMRMKMENRFSDDDDDVGAFRLSSERDRSLRSKSNLSFHTADRMQGEEDEYFTKIYNKKAEKSLSSLNGSLPFGGVKSAPPTGSKKEKDPEVAAAIAELEETFKVLGEGPISPPNSNGTEGNGDENSSADDSSSIESPVPNPENLYEQSNGNSTLHFSPTDGRLGNEPNGAQNCDPNGENYSRRHSRGNDSNTQSLTLSSSGSSSYLTMSSRSSDLKTSAVPNHTNFKRSKNHNPHSVLLQQRKEFQKRQGDNTINASTNLSSVSSKTDFNPEDWTYEPPKIDGFDVARFKAANSKETRTSIIPIIVRKEEDSGYYSRSPDIPSYTKDELDLIASLEREVY